MCENFSPFSFSFFIDSRFWMGDWILSVTHLQTPCGSPLPPISLLLVRSYWNFHTICKIEKKHFLFLENFSILGLVFIYIYITSSVFMLEWKKKVLEYLKDFLQNVQNIFSIFFFVFLLKTKKNDPPLCPPFPSIFFLWGGGGGF